MLLFRDIAERGRPAPISRPTFDEGMAQLVDAIADGMTREEYLEGLTGIELDFADECYGAAAHYVRGLRMVGLLPGKP